MKRLAFALVCAAALALPATAAAQVKVVIDPGHGSQDPGGTGNGLQEKSIVLDVSLGLRDLLEADTADTAGGGEWTAFLTRSDDTFVSLAGRASYANSKGADRFISIHSNAFGNASANGTETFSFSEGSTGAALRNLVQEEMIAAWGLTNRGNKTANFAVLRETAMPAVLSEMAFITNAAEAQLLGSATERDKMSVAHFRALQRHYDIAPYIPGEAPANGIVAGEVSDEAGAAAGASILVDGAEMGASGEDGTFRFELAPGTYSVSAALGEATSPAETVEVTAGAESQVSLTLGGDPGDGDDDGNTDENPLEPDPDGDEWEADSPGCVCQAGGTGGAPFGLVLPALAVVLGLRRRSRR